MSLFTLIKQLLQEGNSFSIKLNNKEELNISHGEKWMVMDYGSYMRLKLKRSTITEYNIPYNSITGIIRRYSS